MSTAVQPPKARTENNQNVQTQANIPANNQDISDTVKPPETQFYTYNNQKPDGNETIKDVSDCFLALFTLALVGVSYMQWKVLRAHETSLVKLAEAALLNAEALIHTERPWLLLELVPTGPNIDEVEFFETAFPSGIRQKHTNCTFHLRNYGKTPAIITAQKWELQIGKTPETPVDLVFFDSASPVQPYVFPQGVSQPKVAVLDQQITSDMKAAFDLGLNSIYICGFFKYRDSVPRKVPVAEYETMFCYLYSESGGEPIWTLGQARYNAVS